MFSPYESFARTINADIIRNVMFTVDVVDRNPAFVKALCCQELKTANAQFSVQRDRYFRVLHSMLDQPGIQMLQTPTNPVKAGLKAETLMAELRKEMVELDVALHAVFAAQIQLFVLSQVAAEGSVFDRNSPAFDAHVHHLAWTRRARFLRDNPKFAEQVNATAPLPV